MPKPKAESCIVIRKRDTEPKTSLRYALIDNAYRKYPDGREVCEKNGAGWAEYYHRIECMWLRQQQRCGLCRKFLLVLANATFEHCDLRGLGGARRDDRIVDDQGNMMNMAAHRSCNGTKGSRRDA